jgi:hypothetical protein
MKKIILIAFVFCYTTLAFAQEKDMYLINKKSKDATFLEENRRIKVFTLNGKAKAGKFKILDDKTIIIKNDTLALESIVKIRKASTFSAIAGPVSIGIGTIFLGGAIWGLAAGGYGIIFTILFTPPGLPLFIVPLTARMHARNKWEYEIVN